MTVWFPPPAPRPGPPPAAPAPAAPLTDAQQADYVDLQTALQENNLNDPELLAWARDQIIGGTSSAQIELELNDPSTVPGKVVDRLYPELARRRAAGDSPWSIQTAVQYRSTVKDLAEQYKLPDGFVTDDMVVNMAVGNVAPTEVADRLKLGAAYAYSASPEARAEFDRLYGTGPGDHLAYWLDPTKAEGLLQQQFAAAQISGSGVQSGFGGLSQGEAEGLAAQGVSADQARQGLGQLAGKSQLFGVLPGEAGGGIGRDVQLSAEFGNDAQAQQQVDAARRARLAVFGSAGGSVGQQGVGGLGSAAD